MNEIDCRKCKHYQMTWNQRQPHQCQLFAFRSSRLPCQIVKGTSGSECEGFSPKQRPMDKETLHRKGGGIDIKI